MIMHRLVHDSDEICKCLLLVGFLGVLAFVVGNPNSAARPSAPPGMLCMNSAPELSVTERVLAPAPSPRSDGAPPRPGGSGRPRTGP